MIFFDKLTDFVFDERKKISSKAAIIILSILGLVLIDNLIGFSYSYLLNNKIEEVQKLNSIISDKTSDKLTIKHAVRLRNETLLRKNVLEEINDYLSGLSFNKNLSGPQKPNFSKKESYDISPNNFWFHVTSSGIYYFFGILMLPLMLFLDKSSSILQRITMSILLSAMFSGIGLFFFWICSLIPMILNNSWFLNYLINFVIQGTIIFLMFKFNKTQ
jgi:hypothetical protein